MPIEDAILEATQNRIRPIFCVDHDIIIWVIATGDFSRAGSELYRASVLLSLRIKPVNNNYSVLCADFAVRIPPLYRKK